MSRSRYWVFTLNNPVISQEAMQAIALANDDITYLIFQHEIGENGTPHFQGYIEFSSRKRLTYVKNHVSDTAHWEVRRGTQLEAINYSRKEDTREDGPWEVGVATNDSQGRRNDLHKFADAIMAGKRKRELFEDGFIGELAKYRHFYHDIVGLTMPIRTEELKVILNYGTTGTGKTRFAYDNYATSEEFWVMPPSNGTVWFDGYDRHKIVLMDDFAGAASKVPLVFTLRIMDRYPMQVPIKGSFTWWLPELLIITTNIHPRKWYKWEDREEQYNALMRRISYVYHYRSDMEPQLIDLDRFRDLF